MSNVSRNATSCCWYLAHGYRLELIERQSQYCCCGCVIGNNSSVSQQLRQCPVKQRNGKRPEHILRVFIGIGPRDDTCSCVVRPRSPKKTTTKSTNKLKNPKNHHSLSLPLTTLSFFEIIPVYEGFGDLQFYYWNLSTSYLKSFLQECRREGSQTAAIERTTIPPSDKNHFPVLLPVKGYRRCSPN